MPSSGSPTFEKIGRVDKPDATSPVVVVGSGYGASVIAARLAARGASVCILERGRERDPADLPRTARDVARERRTETRPLGLFDRVTGDDTDVLVGNALGGTSLINAGVVLRPEASAITEARWPAAIRDEWTNGQLEKWFERAEAALDAREVPAGLALRKVAIHRTAAQGLGQPHRLVPVTVHFAEEGATDDRGARRAPCALCGDCATGCRTGAKNTLAHTYLADAAKHGAALHTQIEVRFVLPASAPGEGWHVFYRMHGDDDAAPVDGVIHARWVVLGAGALGSTSLLLRSRDRGLSVSRRVGHHFGGNGDRSGYGYNTELRADSIGFGDRSTDQTVGPTIASSVALRDSRNRPFLVQEGACPSTMVLPTRLLLPIAAATRGSDTDGGLADEARELARMARDQIRLSPDGALGHTTLYLAMGHDDADGRIVLDEDERPRVVWGAAAKQPVFGDMDRAMRDLVGQLGGTWVPNPNPVRAFGDVPLTVHPLGGCPMGDDHERGAVDADGRVFRADGALHDGLYVADGSIVPSALAANPLLTICALAERIADRMDPSVLTDWSPTSTPTPVAPTPPVGLSFTETMSGHLTTTITTADEPEEFFEAERIAFAERNYASFRLRVGIEDLGRFLSEPRHDAPGEGFVDSKLGTRRTIERARFNLFVTSQRPPQKRMDYELDFEGDAGRRLRLRGFKEVHDDEGFDALDDISTLFTTIHEGWTAPDDALGPVVAQGVLRIDGGAFLAQLASFRVHHAPDAETRVEALSKFGRFFFGELWETYAQGIVPGTA